MAHWSFVRPSLRGPRVRGLAVGGKRIRTQRGPIFGGPARAIPTEFGWVRPCSNVGGADLFPCYLVLNRALSPPYRLLVYYGGTLIRVSRTSPVGARTCLPMIGIRWQPPPLVGSRTYGAPEAHRTAIELLESMAQSLISTCWRRESRRNRNAAG